MKYKIKNHNKNNKFKNKKKYNQMNIKFQMKFILYNKMLINNKIKQMNK